MKKVISTLLLLLSLGFAAHAQTYNMSASTVTTCSGTFYDSGGSAASYGSNQNITMTFTSGTTARVNANFSAFSTENGFDLLYIYDGATINDPLIGVYSGTNSPGSITSSGTSLTFRFTSDGSTQNSGWTAALSCTGTALTAYPLTAGTVTACSGM
ncbi:MAG: CUB domain-containing protein, partial [Bacteroidia bacterium]